VRRTSERSAALRRAAGRVVQAVLQRARRRAQVARWWRHTDELLQRARMRRELQRSRARGRSARRGAAPRAAAAGVAPGPRPQARQPWRSSLPRSEEGSLLPHGEEGWATSPMEAGPAPSVARHPLSSQASPRPMMLQ
jgi:hypothetical protein